ncbi:MAG: hypothetical protein HY590_07785 [Candidatus Omnitrophica bacterium]|nr:hypothetical protein [Candidatus Omnitrophota bacterium]
MAEFIRIWQEAVIQEIESHLLIAGDTVGDCASCRCLGIDYSKTSCPQCKTEFKYVTSRRIESHPGESFRIVKRLKEKRPDLIFVDYTDYKQLSGKLKGRSFLA